MIGIALLFWGWQTGFLVVGAVMAVVIEGRALLGVRRRVRRFLENGVRHGGGHARVDERWIHRAPVGARIDPGGPEAQSTAVG